jgi:hypothetical protein
VASNTSAGASAQAAALCASTFRTALIPQQIPVRSAVFFSVVAARPHSGGSVRVAQRIALTAARGSVDTGPVKKAKLESTKAFCAPPKGRAPARECPILSVL